MNLNYLWLSNLLGIWDIVFVMSFCVVISFVISSSMPFWEDIKTICESEVVQSQIDEHLKENTFTVKHIPWIVKSSFKVAELISRENTEDSHLVLIDEWQDNWNHPCSDKELKTAQSCDQPLLEDRFLLPFFIVCQILEHKLKGYVHKWKEKSLSKNIHLSKYLRSFVFIVHCVIDISYLLFIVDDPTLVGEQTSCCDDGNKKWKKEGSNSELESLGVCVLVVLPVNLLWLADVSYIKGCIIELEILIMVDTIIDDRAVKTTYFSISKDFEYVRLSLNWLEVNISILDQVQVWILVLEHCLILLKKLLDLLSVLSFLL